MLGLPQTEDNIQMLAIFTRSLIKYIEREEEYGQTWKQFDPADAAHHARHKASRMWAFAERPNNVEAGEIVMAAGIDSAIDICNYAAFYIRHFEGTK